MWIQDIFPVALDVCSGPQLLGGKIKKQSQIQYPGDPAGQTHRNNLFGDDMVIWSIALGLVVPIVTHDDSSLPICMPELRKMTFF